MKNKYLRAIAVILIAIVIAMTFFVSKISIPEEVLMNQVAEAKEPRFTHQQEVWMASLEWCESNAVNESVNPKDKDGTPSYYAFQFKPGTFKWLGEKYGVIEKGKTHQEVMELMKQYELQKQIVEFMIEDPGTKWNSQFPGCVKKLGWPPKVVRG